MAIKKLAAAMALSLTLCVPTTAQEVGALKRLVDIASSLVTADASAGDPSAALALALSLLGNEEQVSIETASRVTGLLAQAATGGIEPAMMLLADGYRTGRFGGQVDLDLARTYYEMARQRGDTRAMRQLATLLISGEPSDRGRRGALDLLEAATALGDPDAAVALADALATGGLGTEDDRRAQSLLFRGVLAGSARAFEKYADLLVAAALPSAPTAQAGYETLYDEAVRLGSTSARQKSLLAGLRNAPSRDARLKILDGLEELAKTDAVAAIALGDLFAIGEDVARDRSRARLQYDNAARLGSAGAYARLGELLLGAGADWTTDLQGARAAFEKGVEVGDPDSLRAMAAAYMNGTLVPADPEQAIKLLEAAATAGDATAALTIALALASNQRLQADFARASDWFERALSLGSKTARVRFATALIEGPLGQTHGKDGEILLSAAVQEGVAGALAEWARLTLAGRIANGDVPKVMTDLAAAAGAGDVASARYLLQTYREGAGIAVPKDLDAARSLLVSLRGRVDERFWQSESVLVEAAASRTPEDLAKVADDFERLSREDGKSVLLKLRRVRAEAYVYVLQARYFRLGDFANPPTGRLDRTTTSFLTTRCEAFSSIEVCALGPLSAEVATVLADALFLFGDGGALPSAQ